MPVDFLMDFHVFLIIVYLFHSTEQIQNRFHCLVSIVCLVQ